MNVKIRVYNAAGKASDVNATEISEIVAIGNDSTAVTVGADTFTALLPVSQVLAAIEALAAPQ